jgi:hypothetical protein
MRHTLVNFIFADLVRLGQAHANQRWFESMYLFSGSPEALGLNQGQFQAS